MGTSRLLKAGAQALVLAAGAAWAAHAPAQTGDFPNRPIRLITPAQPGGTTDILARLFGIKLSDSLKQQIVVDNRASASGVIAGELTAKALPDGYTLFMAYHQHTVNAALNPQLPYHAVNDFTPISQLTSAGLLLVINPSSPPKNLKEFIDWTKNFKGPLNFGSAGNGSGGHLAGELYNLAVKIKAQHIPYKGSAPSLIDLVAGQYHYNFVGMLAAQALVKSGKLRALAVTAPKRVPSYGDLPAMTEWVPGFEVVGWYGVLAPPNLPKPLVSKLYGELAKVIKMNDIRERIFADGAEPVGSEPEAFRQYLLADLAKWARLVKESGAKLE
jgi:tripartite-type tricarboxylate transporter receptor subunit TctC